MDRTSSKFNSSIPLIQISVFYDFNLILYDFWWVSYSRMVILVQRKLCWTTGSNKNSNLQRWYRRCYYFIYAQNGTNRGSSRRSSLQVMVTLNSMAPVIVGNFSSLMVWRQVNCKHPQRSGTDIRKPDLWLSLTSLNVKALWVGRSWRMLQTGFNFKKHMVKLASTSPKGTSKYRAPRIHWRSSRVGFRCPAHDFRYHGI